MKSQQMLVRHSSELIYWSAIHYWTEIYMWEFQNQTMKENAVSTF